MVTRNDWRGMYFNCMVALGEVGTLRLRTVYHMRLILQTKPLSYSP